MLRLDGMLMIGAADRNAGKTEFACSVIRRVSAHTPVIGIKVTTVVERNGVCPRGGEGCGACISFTGSLCVTQEQVRDSDKDTSRMLAAGAHRVFWVRVLGNSLDQGAEAIRKFLEPGTAAVCESNSLRIALEPDLFFLVREKGADRQKPSSVAVARFVDAVAEFDGSCFDPSPETVAFCFGHWAHRREAAAIVMAGGQSLRMGCDKAMLPVAGEPMISRIVRRLEPSFEQVLISTSAAGAYSFLGNEVVPDEVAGAGPLMALVSALERSRYEVNFVMPCDMPDVPQHLLARLLRESRDADIAVPEGPNGELEPLFAVYRKSVLPSARAALARGQRRVISFYEGNRVKRVRLPEGTELANLNTMDDYLARTKTR